jgi:hypothetical protein
MEPYENIMIGNFLYALGLSLGARRDGKKVPASINLLQQTPMDKLLGDALIEYPGTMRLLEFKRSKNKSDKEQNKLEGLRTAMTPFPHLDPVSRAVHWYIESIEDQSSDARAVPYLDLDAANPDAQTTMFAFIDALVSEALAGGSGRFDDNLIREYLECVSDWSGESGASSGGLLVMLDERGQLVYQTLDDIRDLHMMHELLREMRLEPKTSLTFERTREMTLEQRGPRMR